MSSYFDDLEAQLRSAARVRAGASAAPGRDASQGRRRRRGWLRAAPVLAATFVALAVVGAALVLLGHRGHGAASGSRPPGGGIGALIAHTPQRQLRRELRYVFAATQGVQNSKACRLQQPSGVTYIQGSPGSDLLSLLGVLRRPATPADEFNVRAAGSVPNVYRAYIRRAFSTGGVSYYIVPARFDRAATIPSDRCFELQTAAFNRYLPKIPASLRRPSREIQAALIAYYREIANGPRDRICLVSVAGKGSGAGNNGTGASCGIAAKGIESGRATENSLGTPLDTFSGVVPDGVATVTLVFPAPVHVPAVTTRVEGNVYAVHFSVSAVHLARSSVSPTIIWRSREGHVLKRTSTSTAATLAFICGHSPIACLLFSAVAGSSSSSRRSGSVHSSPARTTGG